MAHSLTPLDRAHPPFYAGVDVGGTNIKIGLVDNHGHTIAYQSIPTEEERGVEDAVGRMAEGIRDGAKRAGLEPREIALIGLATPGTMDIPAGMILEPPNIPHWRNFPIRDALSKAYGRRVVFANDANAAAYGEFWIGSGKDHKSLAMLTLGTGVGGGIIYDGVSIDGMFSHGSECGHMLIDHAETARMCPCGRRGHLEAYCSATSLVKRCEEALAAGKTSSLTKHLEAGQELTSLLMFQQAEGGDQLCRDLILETAYYLGAGITSIVHCVDPGLVVLGGAVNFGGHAHPLGREFLELVRSEVRRRCLPVPAEKTLIDYAQLGGDAGYIGAAGLARAMHQKVENVHER